MAKKSKKSASESYSQGTDAIIAAAKGGASKQEIRGMVVAHNAKNRGKGAKAKISTQNMWSYMPKPKNTQSKGKKRETMTLPTSIDADGTPSSSTIQVEKQSYHDTDYPYKNYGGAGNKELSRDETYSDYAAEIRGEAPAADLVKPGPPKRAVFKMKGWSGYQNKK
tara:strand:+ start:529 stop:1026 length:498 start_codon:yes stop_codon:yes gene_type:complete